MTDREDLEQRIQSAGIDPGRKYELADMVQYGNVLVSLWHLSTAPLDATAYVVKLEHASDLTPDGLRLESGDMRAVQAGLLWAIDQLRTIFLWIGVGEGLKNEEQ